MDCHYPPQLFYPVHVVRFYTFLASHQGSPKSSPAQTLCSKRSGLDISERSHWPASETGPLCRVGSEFLPLSAPILGSYCPPKLGCGVHYATPNPVAPCTPYGEPAVMVTRSP